MSAKRASTKRKAEREPKTEEVPWDALVDFRQAREIMLALSERDDVRSAFEWFVDEFHNNPTLREFQDYILAEEGTKIGVEEPAVQELLIRPFVDEIEKIWNFWTPIRKKLIRENSGQRAVILDSLPESSRQQRSAGRRKTGRRRKAPRKS